ncbi:MAG TPA: FAD-dependent oxidoreductase, partial [Candidatus Acidoferrum sp.]
MKNYDVVVAGGGLIGGSAAFELARAGMKVGVFDARQPGREASWASGGMISPAPEHPGMIPYVPLSLASVADYPAFIQSVEELTGTSVNYRKKGALDAIFNEDAREELSTAIALQHGVGLRAEALSAEQAREMEPSLTPEVAAAIFRPDEASLDSRLLTDAVLEAARRKGADVVAGNGAKAVWREGDQCKGLILENGRVEAKWTIIAAGCFSARIDGVAPYAPVTPAKGQMIALSCDAVSIERILWAEHTYVVPRNDGRLVAGST